MKTIKRRAFCKAAAAAVAGVLAPHAAAEALLHNLDAAGIPMALLSQYLPTQYARVHAGCLPLCAADLLIDRVGDCIDDYVYAVLEKSI